MLHIKNISKFRGIYIDNFNVVSRKQHSSFSEGYCMNLVKQYDYENFLCTLLLDSQRRRYAFAVRAFNVEVAKISYSVKEESIAKMRLQFWHDSIDKCFENAKSYVSDQPVLRELKFTLDNNKLTKTYFKRLITARNRPSNAVFNTIKDLEDYSEMATSSLYYILLEIWNTKSMPVDHAVSHLGKAQGIVNLLRALPRQNRNAIANIPMEVLIKHGVSQERLLRGQPEDKNVEDCIFDISSVAHQHLQKSQSLSNQVPPMVIPLFLPAVAVRRYLNRLQKSSFKLFDDKLQQRDNLLPLAYFWANFRKKY